MSKPRGPLEEAPMIYVISLADYGDRDLGRWIDATQGVDHIKAEIDELIEESTVPGAGDWEITDYLGFEGLSIAQYEDLEVVAAIGELIDEHGELAAKIIEHVGGVDQVDEARRLLREDHAGSAASLAAWAEQHVEESGDLRKVPARLRRCFDFQKYARELRREGAVFTIRVGEVVHVFWNR